MKERGRIHTKEAQAVWVQPTENEIERLKTLREVWAGNPELSRNQAEAKANK